jgi:hypothetical protein
MSLPPSPDAFDDELASAYLDGAADAEGRARVDSDPRLMVRVDALRAVRSALAAPPEIDAAQRDRAIATALATATADVVPLAPRTRSKRWGRARAAVTVAAAAAIAALIAVTVSRSGTGQKTSAGSAPSAPEITNATAATVAPPAPATSAAPATTAAAGGAVSTIVASGAISVDLGEIDSAAALRDAATKLAGASLAPVATGGVADSSGSSVARAAACSPAPGAALAGRLVWQGTPALLYIVTDVSASTPSRRAIVVASADCGVLATVQY